MVAHAKGIHLDEEESWNFNVRTRESPQITKRYYTSAVRDMYSCRPTEVDFLNGAICREGEKYSIPTPYNEMIWLLARVLQDTYEFRYTPIP
jgi:2-dehydropantoate 2-reductase